SSLIPRPNCQHDCHREPVEKNQSKDDGAHGTRNRFFRLFGFACSHCDDFDTRATSQCEAERKPSSFPSHGKKSTVCAQVGEANTVPGAEAEYHQESNDDERNDREYLYQGKPVLK